MRWKRWRLDAERTGGRCGSYKRFISRDDRRTNASNKVCREIVAYFAIEYAAPKGSATNSEFDKSALVQSAIGATASGGGGRIAFWRLGGSKRPASRIL